MIRKCPLSHLIAQKRLLIWWNLLNLSYKYLIQKQVSKQGKNCSSPTRFLSFLKWVFPKMVGKPQQTHGVFLLKMISTWGVEWGYPHHHFRKPPNSCRTWASLPHHDSSQSSVAPYWKKTSGTGAEFDSHEDRCQRWIFLEESYGRWTKSCTSWYGKYPIIYRVSYIPGGAGFLPSTV